MQEFRQDISKCAVVEQFDPDLVAPVCQWAREFSRVAVPTASPDRFAIGVYQIYQALEWGRRGDDNDGAAESVAAACIHLIGAAELVGVSVAEHLPERFSQLASVPYDPEGLLLTLCRAQQQYCYIRSASPGTARYDRIDFHKLGLLTASLVGQLMSLLPRLSRASGFEHAAEAMIEVAVKGRM